MKAKILRVLSVAGLIIAMGSLSACFEETYHPGYGYGPSAYAQPGYYPQYAPTPRYYASNVPVPRYRPYNPHPYIATPHRAHEGWQREQREERREHEHHNN